MQVFVCKDQLRCDAFALKRNENRSLPSYLLGAACMVWFHFALEIVQEQITPAGTKGKHFVYERTSSMICNTVYEVNYFSLDVCYDLGEADTATSWPVVRGVPGFSLCLCSRFTS